MIRHLPRRPMLDAYPEPKGPTEAEIIAWFGVRRVEDCLCGSTIAAREDAEAIRLAVVAHQGTPQHREWSAATFEPARFGAGPTFDPSVLRDLSEAPTVERSIPRRTGALA